MRSHRALLGAIVVSSAMVLAACTSSSSSPTNAAPPSATAPAPTGSTSTGTTSTGTQGANPGSDFCTLLKAEKAKAAKLGTTIGTAFASNDFATTKKTLTAYFAAVGQALAQVEASMSSAPANVQAALQTVNVFFSQLQSSVASASSLTELQTNISAAANTANLKQAGATLKAYTTSQCGTPSSPTP